MLKYTLIKKIWHYFEPLVKHTLLIFKGNIANSDDDDILSLLFGQEFTNFGDGSPPRSESTSSDSYMTPSPDALDDVELSEILSSTTGSPGVAHSTEDFTIDLGGIFNSVFLYIFAST